MSLFTVRSSVLNCACILVISDRNAERELSRILKAPPSLSSHLVSDVVLALSAITTYMKRYIFK